MFHEQHKAVSQKELIKLLIKAQTQVDKQKLQSHQNVRNILRRKSLPGRQKF